VISAQRHGGSAGKTARLAIGTAQFGTDYGILGHLRSPPEEVARILGIAAGANIDVIDTAHEYGAAELVVGSILDSKSPFRIVTKTPHLPARGGREDVAREIQSALTLSLSRLRRSSVHGLLVHRADDLLGPSGARVYDCLVNAKQAGLVSKIGASAYSGQQIDALLDRFSLDILQLPLNVLDQRLVEGGHLDRLRDAGMETHVRSVFMQGILLTAGSRLPPHFRSVSSMIEAFHETARRAGATALEVCLGFVKWLGCVDYVVVGVDTGAQFQEVVQAFARAPALDLQGFSCHDLDIVDPRRWPAR